MLSPDRLGGDRISVLHHNFAGDLAERLLKLDGSKQVTLCSDNIVLRIARCGFALLIPSNRVLTAGKESFVERDIFRSRTGRSDEPVTDARADESPTAKRVMDRGCDLKPLVIDVAGEILGGQFNVAKTL